ncbi:RIP metalloprotease RseP [Agaribacterium haliotis]|uniref:RIP metalloprotease RseP n=1 Tax=Agaribacterium haliotis TaxID=2013869 RepID=UPI000BB53E0C|nr:RIP metalloprotease RseP [Agaribacterium haliotis]
MPFLTTVMWFLLAISILVAIHEFGHFYVARRCGVKVLRFSIGFGPRLLAFTDKKGTEFALSAIPLGGYVKMLDEREAPVDEAELDAAYNRKSVGQRIAIAAAGPAANLILAFVLYWALLMHGTVVYSPVIGEVKAGSLAQQAGLEAGQEIVAVDGELTPGRRDVRLALLKRLGESGELLISARYSEDGLTYESPIRIQNWLNDIEEPQPLQALGLQFYYPPLGRTVGQVLGGGAAERAGFEIGDKLLAADGEPLTSWEQWVELIKSHPGKPLDVVVERDGEPVSLALLPDQKLDQDGFSYGYAGIGVELPAMPEHMRRLVSYNPLEALGAAFGETWEATTFVFISLKKLLVAEISIKNLSGPIGIAKVAADQAQYGFWAFMSFLAHVSVVLAVLNLLPIPVLDGGHILFCLAEWVKGSPLSEKAQLIGYKAGMAVLMCLMVVAFYNDILRL